MAKRDPKSRSKKVAPTLKGLTVVSDPSVSWCCRYGCVVRRGECVELVVHGTRVASWKEGEVGIHNAMLVQLAQEPNIVLEDLSKAFRMSSEMVRLIRRKAEADGLLSVMLPATRSSTAIAPEMRKRLEGLFAQGMSVEEAYRKMRGKLARSTVSKYRRIWKAQQQQEPKCPNRSRASRRCLA